MGLQEWLAQFTEVLHPVNLAVMGFIEAIFLPIPPDVMLIPMVLLQPELGLGFALLTTVASVAGAAVGYSIGFRGGRPLLRRFAKGPTLQRVESALRRYGFWGIVFGGFLPLPYKLFALSSGVFSLDWRRFLFASLLGRGARFSLVAVVVQRHGAELAEAIVRSGGWFTGALLGLAVAGLLVWWRGRIRSRRAAGRPGAAVAESDPRNIAPAGTGIEVPADEGPAHAQADARADAPDASATAAFDKDATSDV